jgi:hypothetical protein
VKDAATAPGVTLRTQQVAYEPLYGEVVAPGSS